MFLFNIFVLSSCLALCLTQDFDNYDDYYDSRNSSSTSENKTTYYEEANATLIQINAADVAQVLQKIDDLENKIQLLTQNVTGLEELVDEEMISEFENNVNNQLNENSKSISRIISNQQKDHADIGRMLNQFKAIHRELNRLTANSHNHNYGRN